MRTTPKTLTHFVNKSRQLYSLPAVAMEVLELTKQPEVDVRALKACIENDPALTSKVLRVVNSSLFGLASEVSNLQQAISLLGLKPLKLLVLGFSLADTSFSRLTSDVMGRYWRYSLTKAIAAREISQQVWRLPGDEPFIAALLQDIGMLVLIQELGFPYTRFADKVCGSRGDLIAMEIESLGFDHTLLTSRLLEKWSFPKSLCEAVIADRRPGEVYDLSPSQTALCQIVQLARLLADLLVFGRQDILPQLVSAGASEHQLDVQQLVDLACDLQGKVRQLAELLSLQLPAEIDYRDVLAQAQSQLADVAEQSAGQLLGERTAGKHHQTRDAKHHDAQTAWDETRELTRVMDKFLERPDRPDSSEPNQHAAHADLSFADTRSAYQSPSVAPRAAAVRGAPRGADLATASVAERGATHTAASEAVELPDAVLQRLRAAVTHCRQAHIALSLALVEIDRWQDLRRRFGTIQSQLVMRRLHESLAAADVSQCEIIQVGEAQFAILLPGCDRQTAVQLGQHLVRTADELLAPICVADGTPHSLSVGVATVPLPAKNFAAAELAVPALRCLAAAQRTGGNALKSIGVY